jgi:hypothetical protein
VLLLVTLVDAGLTRAFDNWSVKGALFKFENADSRVLSAVPPVELGIDLPPALDPDIDGGKIIPATTPVIKQTSNSSVDWRI